MDTIFQDIRYGVRMLMKTPGTTALAIVALAIGIGANSTIFTMVNSILLSPMPFPTLDRMMRVCEIREGQNVNSVSISGPNYLDIKEKSISFEALSLVTVGYFNLTGHGEPERISAYIMTSDIFDTADDSMTLGRQFIKEEEEPGKNHVVVIGYGYWKDRFGGDPNILNDAINLDGTPYTIIGILPADMGFMEGEAKIWLPLSSDEIKKDRGNRRFNGIGILKEGVSVEQARAELAVISDNLSKEYPETNKNYKLFVEPMLDRLVRFMAVTFIILHGAVGFVLLLACSIVASLLLARASVRQKEIAIRSSLGANRARIIRQMLTESVILALAGGICGLMLTMWGIDLLKSLLPEQMVTFVTRIGIDTYVLGFTLTVSLVTGILFGLAPALQTTKLNLLESLNEGGRSSIECTRSQRILRYLVVAEIAFSLILLIGAGLMVNSFIRLQSVDPGFDSQNMLTFHLPLTSEKYKEDSQKLAFYRDVTSRIEHLPGIQSVASTSVLPLTWGSGVSFEIQNLETVQGMDVPYAEMRQINPAYFQVLKIPLLKGRSFTSDDENPDVRRVIINEFLARRFETIGDPIGKYIKILPWDSALYEVVGVVGNVKHFGLTSEDRPTMYIPFLHRPAESLCFAIRTSGDPNRLTPSVRQQIWAADPDLPIELVRTMDRLVADTMIMDRFTLVLVSLLSVVALILSSMGIYGIMAYSVSQRTHEIGVRVAIGAQLGDVVKLIVWQGMKLILTGVVIGLIGSFIVTRILVSSLYGITATDPITYLTISLLLTGVSVLACYVPARKAAKVDPMVTLRCE
ncbi:MAG: ABC transporter permease [Candidatus Omnitrophica bacterium]|nr:ABC transporter permease [Candidatus Omnitrophota bacterium]